jgi:hypothetical protein
MQSSQIVLPCTVNVEESGAGVLESTNVKISAPEKTFEWLRMAGVDLHSWIRSCLLVYRVPELLYRSYIYEIDTIDGTFVYSTRLLGQIEGTPLPDNRGLHLLDLDTAIQNQLNIGPKDASNIKISETKASRIVESFQSWKEQTGDDMRRSKFYGAAILLNWL